MAHLAVIGCGYVGTVSAACFARLGHRVDCIDVDPARIRLLQSGRSPIHEPGLEPLLQEGIRDGRLRFLAGYPDRIEAEFAFIAVNTPGSQEGPADLRAVRDAVSSVASRLGPGGIIVNKSTVPIGTGDLVEGMALRSGNGRIPVVSNPEFLREGSAVHDFLHPDRIVLGSNDPGAIERVAALYAKLSPRIQRTDIRTAEMIKYASNAFLATKISFINEMAAICEALGADVEEVARGMGMDERIGPKFLRAGLGWGGSCFPKDVRALAHMAAVHGTNPQLLRSVIDINKDQRLRVVRKLRMALHGLEGRRILILGAAFKPDTDDIRNSPALELAELLRLEGAHVAVYDPVVPAERIHVEAPEVDVVPSADQGAEGADAIVIATDWPQFHELPLDVLGRVMAQRVLFDARNFFAPAAVREAGFAYLCMGRPAVESPEPADAPGLMPDRLPVPGAVSIGGVRS
ncbi:MAG: UDP-glucose/GDP-mannose dehydrogenase family protein [Dehalococcoidia bacterium]